MQNFITYKNSQIGFSSTGKGSVVVLLHGFLENSTMWNGITPTLSKKNRVITIDLLGHGDTECLGYIHTMEDQAKMIKFVLNHLKLRRFTIIGHSMGGYIALSFAHLFPENTKGICLLNSTYENDSQERKSLRLRAIKTAGNNYKSMVRISFTNLFSENSSIFFKSEIKKALNEALKTPLQGYIAAQEGMKIRKDFTSFFKNASFRKLVVIAKKDSVIDAKKILSFTQKNNIPVSVLQEGHMSHIENKKELIEVLKGFVK